MTSNRNLNKETKKQNTDKIYKNNKYIETYIHTFLYICYFYIFCLCFFVKVSIGCYFIVFCIYIYLLFFIYIFTFYIYFTFFTYLLSLHIYYIYIYTHYIYNYLYSVSQRCCHHLVIASY